MPDSLWVCFEPPAADPPPDALVLSFLEPAVEQRLSERWGERLVSGRAVVQDVRARARRAYVELIARIGATPSVNGHSLRQALAEPGRPSRWWFMKVSEKDCVWDGDPVYTTLLRLMAVRAVADKHGVTTIRLVGADRGFARALGQAGPDPVADALASARAVVRGLLGRMRFVLSQLARWWRCRATPAPPALRSDVLLHAHWGWTLQPDGAGRLVDTYFTELPARLAARGITVGWLATIERDAEGWRRGQRLRDVFAAAARPEVVLLERYVGPADIVAAALRLRHPLAVRRFMAVPGFRRLFHVDGLDLYPVLRPLLLDSAWGSGLARWELLATATERACRALRPAMLVTFLELFLESKALYAGARAASPGIQLWTAQHAGYSSDKTFGSVDPVTELRGEPDGCPTPAPDGIFVMGDLAQRLWRANGLSDDRVVVAGGLRYHGVRIVERPRPAHPPRPLTILMIGGMNESADLDMCRAIVGATAGLDDVRLRLRDHPQYWLSRRAGFRSLAGRIEVTAGTVDEDLAGADIVLVTHSGLAEEALLKGLPTWHWLWAGFNTSVFLDLPVIPAFTGVGELGAAVRELRATPEAFRPRRDTQELVLRECFGADPTGAADRIADRIAALLERQPVLEGSAR